MKVKKKILSLLLAIAMILGMLPMTALPVYAADATQIKIWDGTEMQTYTLGTDTLPNGLSWNSTYNRLELDGYDGGRIEQATSGDELTFYVVNDSIIEGGEETALRYSNPTIDGVAGKTLTLTGTKRSVMYIEGSCTIKNITVKVDQKGTVKNNGYTMATSGNINVRENGRLEVELNKETDNPYPAQGVSGNLRLYDNGSASITVTANNTSTTDAYGVSSLYLDGTGDCDITVTNNGSGNTWAVQYEPNIYSSYNVTGAWNSPSVSYKVANPDTNADLSALTCDLGAVSPEFKANVTSYTGPDYSYYKNKAGIKATVAVDGATLKINGESAVSGVYKEVPIEVGENVIPVVVTSKDSSTTKTYTLTITRQSGGSYNLTVVNGSKDPDTDTVEAGDTVTITANTPDTGKVFDKWTSTDGVAFADASSATTTFTMPTKAVTVTATYKNDPNTDTEIKNIQVKIRTSTDPWVSTELTPAYNQATRNYAANIDTANQSIMIHLEEMVSGQSVTATVDGGPLTVTKAGNVFNTAAHTLTKATTVFVFTVTAKDGTTKDTYTVTVNRGSGTTYALTVINGTTTTPTPAEGDTVTITANPPATGKIFDKWTSTDGVTFANASSATTTFTMPANAVTVTATYKNDPDMDTELKNIAVTIKKQSTTWEHPALTPVYDKATRTYTLNVGTEYKTIYFYLEEMLSGQLVTATVDGAPLTVNTALDGFETVQHTLTNATTVFVFTVTAKDGITKDTYTVTVNRGSGTTYAVTVTNGTGGGNYAAGATVSITANEPATGKVFDKWTTTDGVTFANENTATTTFTMPANDVTVTATYKDAPVTTYAVTVNSGTGGGDFAEGATVSITANAPATGKVFDKWTTSDGVTFGDENTATTTFVMPAKAVTVTATYKDAPVDPDPEKFSYKIIKGANGKWDKTSKAGLEFISNGDFDKFEEVKVDGKTIDKKHYIAKAGSTIVTLKDSLLSTLGKGDHSLTLVFEDGKVETKFTILEKETLPKTGDAVYPTMLFGFILLLAGVFMYRRREA